MLSVVIEQIEDLIDKLSKEEQQRLIKQLNHRFNRKTRTSESMSKADFKQQLVEMAKDPEIQTEVREISREFKITENDGLNSK